MKKKLSVIVLAILVSACDNNQPVQEGHKHEKKMSNKNIEQKKVNSENIPEELNGLLKINEDLHAAYFNYDQDAIKKHIVSITSYVKEIKNSELQKKLSVATQSFEGLSEESSREIFNEKYHLFNIQLIEVLDQYRPSETYSRYHCPMVKKDWIQNTVKDNNKTKNPYAPEMKSCGVRKS
ncbi:MAG TPA: hypothetical protein PKC21_01825 [Oligoflexia bacterium]|nr:hypothetical protein [bacterium]HMQ11365.1 hypothetical protein [Oligoflexia bacterium]HMR24069.1 hypothetical protein [Oligoflexia bacterium]